MTGFANVILALPANYTQLLSALDFALGPSQEIVIVGQRGEETTEKMLTVVEESFIPNKIVLFRPLTKEAPKITEVAPFTKELTAIKGRATAHVCQNYQCGFPTTDVKKFLQ